MSSTAPKPSRALWQRLLPVGVVVVIVLAGMMSWSQFSGSASERESIEVGSVHSADRVDITATVVQLNATSGELVLRLQVTPRGSLTKESGLSPSEDLEILTSPAMKSDPSFPAMQRIGTVDVPVALDGNGITAYPFDEYEALLEFSAKHGGENVPVSLHVSNKDALFSSSAEPVEDSATPAVQLQLNRSIGVLTFAIFMIIAMWALAISVATAAWYLLSFKRGLIWPALGWMAATLFAIAGFRNAAPGSPPIGSSIDYLAFFWAEAIIASCVFAIVMFGVRLESQRSD